VVEAVPSSLTRGGDSNGKTRIDQPRRSGDDPAAGLLVELRLRRENEIRSLASGDTPEKILPRPQASRGCEAILSRNDPDMR
jgi:hypothetical protein